jgi:hypothetical protein
VGGVRPPPFITFTITSSVADPGCLSRILIFTHSGSRIQKQQQKRGVKKGGGVSGSRPMSKAVHRSPNKLWRSNSIFNLWSYQNLGDKNRFLTPVCNRIASLAAASEPSGGNVILAPDIYLMFGTLHRWEPDTAASPRALTFPPPPRSCRVTKYLHL